jgi:hypothetical protein
MIIIFLAMEHLGDMSWITGVRKELFLFIIDYLVGSFNCEVNQIVFQCPNDRDI